MNKLRVTALLLAVILAVGGIVLKISGYDAQTDFEPTLPLDTVLNSEQAQKDLKYVYDTVRAKHPVFLIDDGAEKRFGDVYIKLRRELMDKDSVTVKELWEKSAELVCTLDDAHTIVTVSGTEYVNGGNEISKAYNDGTLVSIGGQHEGAFQKGVPVRAAGQLLCGLYVRRGSGVRQLAYASRCGCIRRDRCCFQR